MSMREGYTFNHIHFTRTITERGGERYFINGKPTPYAIWQAAINLARKTEALESRIKVETR